MKRIGTLSVMAYYTEMLIISVCGVGLWLTDGQIDDDSSSGEKRKSEINWL